MLFLYKKRQEHPFLWYYEKAIVGVKGICMVDRIERILRQLDDEYGIDTTCYLNYETPWQLLVATILSARCTDHRVNIITNELFKKYTDIESLAYADANELEQWIRSAGFTKQKTKSIIGSMKLLHEGYADVMPSDIDVLTTFPGVGRKTANVVRGHIFNIPSIVVDTHVSRISQRLGITTENDPVRIEYDLMKKLPMDHWILWNKQLIAHGRSVCKAVKSLCRECILKEECKWQLANEKVNADNRIG